MTAPTPPPPVATAPKKKRWPWIVAAVVLVLGIGAAVGGKKDTQPAAAAATTTAAPAVPAASSSTAEPTTSSAARFDDQPTWTEVSVADTDPIDGTPARNIKVDVSSGWSDSLAERISRELWVKYGDVVRIEYRCQPTGDYLGRATQDGALGFEGSVNRTASCD